MSVSELRMAINYYRIDLREIPKQYDGIQLLKVNRESEIRIRKEVERFAYYFKREFNYDFPQYSVNDKTYYTAYLFTNGENQYPHVWIGACCFRSRNYADLGLQCEALQWVWIHPYFRTKGI